LFRFHQYLVGHAKADGHLTIADTDSYRSPHEHGTEFGYPLAWSDTQRAQATHQTVSAVNPDHYGVLSGMHLTEWYLSSIGHI
jgi:hypothetical protein